MHRPGSKDPIGVSGIFQILIMGLNVCLSIIMRNSKARIPDSHIELKVGDKLLFFSKPEHVSKIEDLFI